MSLTSILTLLAGVLSLLKLWILFPIQTNSIPNLSKVINYYLDEKNMIELFKFHGKQYIKLNLITLIIYLIISLIVCFYAINILTQLLFLTNLGSLNFYLNVFTRESSDNSQLKLIILLLNVFYFTLFLNENRMDKKQLNLFKSYFVFACLTICVYQIDGIFSRLNYFCVFLTSSHPVALTRKH